MSVVRVDNLHLRTDPEATLRVAARSARAGKAPHSILVRCPDRASSGVVALRASDVARLMQRYSRVRELAVTDGGTIVAAGDVTKRRGELAVWTGYAIGPWHPSDIITRGLGGSETAAVRLAEQFASMGWTVTLYGQFEQAGLCGDVMLRDFQEFDPSQPLDALIGFRDARLFDHRPNARFCALWLEDLPGQEALTRARAENIDRVCAVTRWHKRALHDAYPWLPARQVAACRNGIVHEFFDGPAPERERRVVYTSSPDRGADVLLDVWPQVRAVVPDAELVLTYSRWYDLVAQVFTQAQEHRKRMYELLEQPGVRRLEGGLGQRDLAHLMRSSLVWAHPSWYTAGDAEFHETSCISAMEAQAAGCVVVASNWGALTETVQVGTLVSGDPRERDGSWRHTFVDALVRGLTDENVQTMAQTVGPEYVRDMDWRGAAEQVAAMFEHSRNGLHSGRLVANL